MNDDLLAKIDQATAAHALWKVRLLDAAAGTGAPLDRALAGNCQACEFGKWLDGNQAELSAHPEVAVVRVSHQAFHEEVGRSLDLIAAGGAREVQLGLGADGAFRLLSTQLVLELLRWRDRLAD